MTHIDRKRLRDRGSIEMEPARRRFLFLAATAAALPCIPQVASALDYPTRPVRIIDGFAPGVSSDILARLVAQWLSDRLGQQFVVENRPGASGNVGTEAVVRAPPDGYTLLLSVLTNSINTTLYPDLHFNFTRDIVPVAFIGITPYVMVVNPAFPAKTIPESSPTPKPIPARSTWPRPVSGRRHMCSANYSR
jgi:tripartite-type tricarboxylate transporter receptor subunit TctC